MAVIFNVAGTLPKIRKKKKIGNTNSGLPKRKSKVKSVEVWGKRWFQKSYGNTYHKVKVYVNDKLIGTSDITYGYGDSYLQTAKEILIEKGYFPKELKNTNSLSMFFRDKKIDFTYYVNDVNREKDLKNF